MQSAEPPRSSLYVDRWHVETGELADNCCGVPVSPHYWLWAQSIVIDPADLKNIEAPVLVVAGDHDLTSIEETTEIFRDLRHGNLLVVPRTEHDTYQTRRELVNLAIREFLHQPCNGAQSPSGVRNPSEPFS